MSALDELNKVISYWESYKTNPSTAKLTISGDTLKQAAAELAAKDARIAELEGHIRKLIGLSLQCNEDDPWIYEKNGGEEIVSNASAALAGEGADNA